MQFKDRPEEFAKYLKDVKGVDITGNSGIVKTFWIFGGAMIAIPQLDEKVSKNVHYVYILLSGITFGFSIVGVYTVLTQRILI